MTDCCALLQLLESHAKEAPVSIRKLDTVEEVLKESDVSCPNHQSGTALSQHLLAYQTDQTHRKTLFKWLQVACMSCN